MKFDGFGSWKWISADPISMEMNGLEKTGYETVAFLSKISKFWKGNNIQKTFFDSLSNETKIKKWIDSCSFVSPVFIRLDLVLDEKGQLWIIEIELQPAGWGILQRMQEVYGISPTVGEVTAELINEEIVYSMPGYKDSRPEAEYFVRRVSEFGGKMRFLPIEKWEEVRDFKGIIFRNCCTLDLIKENYPPFIPPKAVFTPPLELDWKGWLAMAMSQPLNCQPLARYIPETYILPLKVGKETEIRRKLLDASRKERKKWILKPIASWGAKGFIEDPLNLERWNRVILGIPPEVSKGYILQRKILSYRFSFRNDKKLDGLSARISPFYISWKGRIKYVGCLITLRKSLKVHGASDAVMTLGV